MVDISLLCHLGYDRFFIDYQFKKQVKEVILTIERLNKDAVNKGEVLVQRSEGTGLHMSELRINDGETRSELTTQLAKSHKQDIESKAIIQIPYVLPDPYHTWYASFTVTQTLRMWMSQFENTSNIQDRIQALHAMEYFKHPPEKVTLPDPDEYTKKKAFADLIFEQNNKRSKDLLLPYVRIGKRAEKKNQEKRVADDFSNIEIPSNMKARAKERMMSVHKRIKKRRIEQDLNPDDGPVDYYTECIIQDTSMLVS